MVDSFYHVFFYFHLVVEGAIIAFVAVSLWRYFKKEKLQRAIRRANRITPQVGPEALAAWERVLHASREQRNHAETAAALNNIAANYSEAGDKERADDYLQQAVAAA